MRAGNSQLSFFPFSRMRAGWLLFPLGCALTMVLGEIPMTRVSRWRDVHETVRAQPGFPTMSKIKKNGNQFVFTKVVEVPAGGTYHLAVNLKTTGLPRLNLRARARGAGLAGHELRLFEDADVVNTLDPERGRHRNRFFGDDDPPFGEDEVLTPFLFHSEQFSIGPSGLGAELFVTICPSAGTSDTGWWKLEADEPKHYLLELTNTADHPAKFSVEVDYSYERST